MRLNPQPPQWYYLNLSGAYTQLGRYEESEPLIKKAIALSPKGATARAWLIILYGAMGKENEALATAAELLKIDPKFSAERFLKAMAYKDDAYPKLAVESLRKAGLLK